MIWYEVNGYTTLDDSHDIETVYEGKSLKKAEKLFENMKKDFPMVRIDKWQGNAIGDGDYIEDVACWRKG